MAGMNTLHSVHERTVTSPCDTHRRELNYGITALPDLIYLLSIPGTSTAGNWYGRVVQLFMQFNAQSIVVRHATITYSGTWYVRIPLSFKVPVDSHCCCLQVPN